MVTLGVDEKMKKKSYHKGGNPVVPVVTLGVDGKLKKSYQREVISKYVKYTDTLFGKSNRHFHRAFPLDVVEQFHLSVFIIYVYVVFSLNILNSKRNAKIFYS